jgi:hypothetical protein
MLRPERVRDCMHRYQPPFEEFQVLSVQVEQAGTVSIPAQRSPMVLLCLYSTGLHCLQVSAAQLCTSLALQTTLPFRVLPLIFGWQQDLMQPFNSQ